MEILTAILCISAFIVILLIVKMTLRKDIKDLTIKVGFFQGI